jgi:hypothetical protein
MENPEIIKSKIDDLNLQLKKAGIDVSGWGTGGYKTLEHLSNEIESQETILTTDTNGELLRKIEVVGAAIFYFSDDGKKYSLKEEKQIFIDGRERRRLAIKGRSIFEKMKPNEDPKCAIIRGIQEELGIKGDIDLRQTDTYKKIGDSDSYPGLKTESTLYMFNSTLSQEQFNPDGYIEEQPDKTTYFTWIEIE